MVEKREKRSSTLININKKSHPEYDKLMLQFDDLAKRMNVKIIRGKGDFKSGSCQINGERTIVLNRLKPVKTQLQVLARSFKEFGISDTYIVPAFRLFIEEGANQPVK
jgi:hypothetical protein